MTGAVAKHLIDLEPSSPAKLGHLARAYVEDRLPIEEFHDALSGDYGELSENSFKPWLVNPARRKLGEIIRGLNSQEGSSEQMVLEILNRLAPAREREITSPQPVDLPLPSACGAFCLIGPHILPYTHGEHARPHFLILDLDLFESVIKGNHPLIDRVLGREVATVVTNTSHASIAKQQWQDTSFLSIPVLSINADQSANYLLKREMINIYIGPHGVIIVDETSSRLAESEITDSLAQRVSCSIELTNEDVVASIIDGALAQNKTTLRELNEKIEKITNETKNDKPRSVRQVIGEQIFRIRKALGYAYTQIEETRGDIELLHQLYGAKSKSTLFNISALQAEISSQRSKIESMMNELKKPEEDLKEMTATDFNTQLVKLTVPVTASAVFVVVDVSMKLLHEAHLAMPAFIANSLPPLANALREPALIGLAIAWIGTAVSIAWGVTQIRKKSSIK